METPKENKLKSARKNLEFSTSTLSLEEFSDGDHIILYVEEPVQQIPLTATTSLLNAPEAPVNVELAISRRGLYGLDLGGYQPTCRGLRAMKTPEMNPKTSKIPMVVLNSGDLQADVALQVGFDSII